MYNKLIAGLDAEVQTGQILPSASGLMEFAVRALQQQVNEFTNFENQEDVPDQTRTHWNFPCLTWSRRVSVFVKACPMLIALAHMQQSQQLQQQLQQQSSSQRVGALSLIPFCLGISGHPSGSRQGHPRYTGARSAGRLWVARTQFSTAVQCRNTANMVAEQCRSRARALAARALLTRV